MVNSNNKPGLLLLPLIGILVFTVLYIVATSLYPGGSQADKAAAGFSWMNNYWCNLLNEKAINGEQNTAQPVAIAGMLILCISLAAFWYQFAGSMNFTSPIRNGIRISGMLSGITGLFLFSKGHDSVINISGGLALFALAGTFYGLYKNKWLGLFGFGIFNIALIMLNNIIYYGHELKYLPFVQKISFLSFLLWVSLMILKLYKRERALVV